MGIAGDYYDIGVMVPPGASPVTYEPTPQQIRELSESFAYIRIGHIEFEKSWMKKLKSVNPDMDVINLSKNAVLIEPEHSHDHSHDHNGHHHHGVDPHIWTSPKEVRKQAEIIFHYLSGKNPEMKESLGKNYSSFLNEIDSLDTYLEKTLEPYKNRKFLIFHPALSYIAHDYGLEQISI